MTKKLITISAEGVQKLSEKIKNAAVENAGQEKEEISIVIASIKDEFCDYTYQVTAGKAIGFKHSVDGKGIIKDSLREAFTKLNVHLACIDDIFKHAGVDIDDIDQMHNDDLALLYTVTGFTIKGTDDNESIILKGNKYLSGGGRMEITCPKTAIDDLSSYKWHNDSKRKTYYQDDAERTFPAATKQGQ